MVLKINKNVRKEKGHLVVRHTVEGLYQTIQQVREVSKEEALWSERQI